MKPILIIFLYLFLANTLFSQDSGTFIDTRDSQTYSFRTFSGQIWMSENLKFKAENSWCYNNDSSKCGIYGRLYSWESAKTSCPAGWHLPSVQEWIRLISFYGGKDNAGKYLPINPFSDINKTGFNAFFVGGYLQNDEYKLGYTDLGTKAYFWTSTVELNLEDYSMVISITKDQAATEELSESNNRRFSVRCVKN